MTWETLVREHYHVSWHPQILDYAMNRRPGASSIEQVLRDRKFLRACQQFAAARKGETRWNVAPNVLSDIGHPQAAAPRDAYLAAQTNRAMRTLKCVDRSAAAREEIFATIRHQYLAQAADFRPGVDLGNDTFQSYGYAAYHERFLPRSWNAIAKARSAERVLERTPIRNDEHQSWSDRVDARARDVDDRFERLKLIGFKSALADALRAALSEARCWDVFHAMIYRGEKASSLAARWSVSQGHISDAITNKILDALRLPLASFYDCASRRRIRITALREPLCDLLPESDFLALVPRPLPALPLPLKRDRQPPRPSLRPRVGGEPVL